MKKKKYPLLENILITDVAAEGVALARVNDVVVFVPHVVPGDVVDVQINRKRSNYMEGFPVKIHTFSPDRIKPFCNHFGICGGCKWQILPYEKQLYYKTKQVTDVFTRIGKFAFPSVKPIIASDETVNYRNKLEFSCSNKRWLTEEDMKNRELLTNTDAIGFHVTGRFDKIIDITHCSLQKDPSNEIRNAAKEYACKQGLTFFDIRDHKGLLRSIIIRNSSIGELMVICSFFENDRKSILGLMEFLKNRFPQITSLHYVVNPKGNDTISDLEIICYSGKDYIVEKMEDLEFIIGPKSFYQTNSNQAYKLYKVAREFAGLSGNEVVYDLYTGTGTIAHFVAKNASKVIGIEYVDDAIEDAKKNSVANSITNTNFVSGDMKDVFTADFIQKNGIPDVIILDPPRAGVHQDVVTAILGCKPKVIVYVSCNPATQARDIALMSDQYKVTDIQPVDMFPHTHHVENVVRLIKK